MLANLTKITPHFLVKIFGMDMVAMDRKQAEERERSLFFFGENRDTPIKSGNPEGIKRHHYYLDNTIEYE